MPLLEPFGAVHLPALGPALIVLWGCWLVLLGLGVRALPSWWRERDPDELRLRWAVSAVVAVALGVRLFVAPMTPEMRWRLFYAFSTDGPHGVTDIEKYGLGWPLLARTAVAVFGRHHEVPFVLNAVLGALAVVPMVGLVRAVGGDRRTAWWCGASLAAMPMLVWFSHTDAPFPSDLLFTLLTLWATARYAATHAPVWLVVAVCAVVSTAQMRVESVSTGPIAVMLVLALADRFPFRRGAPWAAAAAAALLLVPHALVVGPTFAGEWALRFGERQTNWALWRWDHFLAFSPTMQAEWVFVAAPIGLLFGRVPAPVRVWALVVTVIVGMTIPDVTPRETAFSVARYQLRSLPFAALLAGLGLVRVAALAPRPLWGLLCAAAMAWGLRLATTVSVLKTEHDFFAANLTRVPEGCTVVTWLSQNDTVGFVPVHLSAIEGRELRWVDLDEVPAEGCAWYYQSGGCTGHYQGGINGWGFFAPPCDAFLARWRLEPVVEAELPSDPVGPMGIDNRFPGVPIPVGFYRILGPAAP